MKRVVILLNGLVWLSATLMGFLYPGTDQTLGQIQRLFYIHFGSYYTAFWLFIVAVGCGALYLRNPQPKWDYLQKACIEVGLWFLSMTILTGMFVARATWGVYWAWDSRLTTVAIMWLTYTAYFFLRGGIEAPDVRRRLAAVYAMLAFAAVIMSMLSLRIHSNLTSAVLDFTSLSLGMSPRIGLTVWANIVAYSLVGGTLVWYLVELTGRREKLEQRKLELWDGP
jgi:heme exporter protein C